ncbi:MAG: hypothetical protein H7Y20_17140, partial [Bryobacteraceae bacterium]|nr:hypothetical protein [Bryobacteraceae bacterium]
MNRPGINIVCVVLGCCLALLGGCGHGRTRAEPRIEFTSLPPAGDGSPEHMASIRGRVIGAENGHRIVLFARSGVWWVQPTAENPFTAIKADSTWNASTHPGSAYAALVVSQD